MNLRKYAFNHVKYPIKHADRFVKLSRFKILRRMGKTFLDPAENNLSYIPITEDIDAPPGTLVPLSVVEHFINSASYLAVVNHCICRTASGCKNHDPDLGCMFLGEGAREIDPEMGKEVTREEALEHFNRAIASGLVPGIGKAKADAVLLGVEDRNRLMTLCFCCDCCCAATALHNAPKEVWGILVKLDGVEIELTDDCIGCGKCVDACIFDQITIDSDGRPVIGDYCKTCGRCTLACEQKALKVKITNPDYINACIERISDEVEVSN